MPSTVTVISREEITPSIMKFCCNMPNVAAGGNSPNYQLPIDPFVRCSLNDFAIVCASSTFTYVVSDVAGVSYPSVDCRYREASVNLYHNDSALGVLLRNSSSLMYFGLTNTDTGNATGVITVSYTVRD